MIMAVHDRNSNLILGRRNKRHARIFYQLERESPPVPSLADRRYHIALVPQGSYIHRVVIYNAAYSIYNGQKGVRKLTDAQRASPFYVL